MRRVLLAGAVLGLLLLLAGCGQNAGESIEEPMKIYKSSNCGCCGIYSNYASGQGVNVQVEEVQDVQSVKKEYGVPSGLSSCHTSIIGDYFVEGHVPLEAVEKLMSEKPDIAGIALPGMPSGSPGMPGPKRGDWTIYAVDEDGSTYTFMKV